ncbi:hypothetical protein AVP_16 [Aerococcus phage vB_AviM_AVP]|nr:hypothetical protein AVP_16 [Aerococcus phage vB_AviM_AVP]
MFNEIIEKEIWLVKFEIEDLIILIEGQEMPKWERDELINEWIKLKGKLDGLEFALKTYLEN